MEIGLGGQDVICVKQNHVSTVSPTDVKIHLEDLGDLLFSDRNGASSLNQKTRGKNKVIIVSDIINLFLNCHTVDKRSPLMKVPDVFFKILQSNNFLLTSHSESSSKDVSTQILP